MALIKNIDPNAYEVFVVSPRNYFLNTPLLPGVTVGTVEARSLIQPVRNLLPGKQPHSASLDVQSGDGFRNVEPCSPDENADK